MFGVTLFLKGAPIPCAQGTRHCPLILHQAKSTTQKGKQENDIHYLRQVPVVPSRTSQLEVRGRTIAPSN